MNTKIITTWSIISIMFFFGLSCRNAEKPPQTVEQATNGDYFHLLLVRENKRNGILMHTGWNYGFTEGCILTMNYNDIQKVIDNPQNYITTNNEGIKNVSWDNSAPTTMSLYEYVEKNVPNGTAKGQIIITEDNEVVDIPTQKDETKQEKKEENKIKEEKSFFEIALEIISIIITSILE